MCDDQDRAAPEGLGDCALDQGVSLQVNGGCGFVNDDDLGGDKTGVGAASLGPEPGPSPGSTTQQTSPLAGTGDIWTELRSHLEP